MFIVVDSFVADVRISILCAIVFASGQLVFTYVKHHRFEWFVLLDVGLIVARGAISIVFDNEFFFKIKPALVEGVTIVFFGGMLLAPDPFLLRYFGRMMPGKVLSTEALGVMKLMLIVVCSFTVSMWAR